MPRALPEWIGRTPDSPVPPRVRVRVFDRYGGICQCGCGRKIMAGDAWDCEDEQAIINGGERRENNLRPFLRVCHPDKTKRDVELKSKNYRVRAKHLGVFAPKQKIKSRGFARTAPQRSATKPIQRHAERT